MTQAEMQTAAKTFSENWAGKGDEKQETSRFWIGLLGDVLGISSPQNYIQFEKRVKRVENEAFGDDASSRREITHASDAGRVSSRTNFIDAYISETKVLIEQKGIKIDLNKAYEQSGGTVLTPYQQAKRYSDELPLNLKPRWIVVSNFAEIHVHDMNNPDAKPEVIFLKDLEKDFYRLEFLVDRKNENIRREVDISVAAGALVGKMYDALVKEYINPTAESYRSLNILCVRLVFCFYAEDAGLFETRTSFEDYIKSFAIENLRDGMIKLFKALDTKLDSRDKYDLKLKPFPYVNGGLFHDENIEIPNFTQEIVDVLVNDCAPFNWSEISPTIFGAVFESTLNPETRRKGGMHYTSIENIHKVIDPLFLDELNAEFDEIIGGDASSRRESRKNKIIYTKGNLPHWHIDGAIQFVTFRLADSLPQEKLTEFSEQKERFFKNHPEPWSAEIELLYYSTCGNKIDEYLDFGYGSCCLRFGNIRKIVENALLHFDGERYKIHSFVIMPNHVHVVVEPLRGNLLSEILHSWKSFSAHEINKVLGTGGSIWQKESFDRVIRNEKHYKKVMEYIQNNPATLKKNEYTLYLGDFLSNKKISDAGRVSY